MISIDDKISFVGGFALTAVTSISVVGLFQAAAVGLIGGFFGLLGKQLYYYTKEKVQSAKTRVWLIGLYDRTVGKFRNWF